jgi:hypothetical protein
MPAKSSLFAIINIPFFTSNMPADAVPYTGESMLRGTLQNKGRRPRRQIPKTRAVYINARIWAVLGIIVASAGGFFFPRDVSHLFSSNSTSIRILASTHSRSNTPTLWRSNSTTDQFAACAFEIWDNCPGREFR